MDSNIYICTNAEYCGGGKTGQPTPQACLDFQKDYAGHYFFACMKREKRAKQIGLFEDEAKELNKKEINNEKDNDRSGR